jgi:hypothetical protein
LKLVGISIEGCSRMPCSCRPEDIKTEKDKDYDSGLDRDSVAMEGWLMKRNQRGVEWWKKRYFVLRVHHLRAGHGLLLWRSVPTVLTGYSETAGRVTSCRTTKMRPRQGPRRRKRTR